MSVMKKLTLFYDALCPLCQAEIVFLSGRNHAGLLSFVDINSEQYSEKEIGISCQQALASMYAQFEDGTLINGVDVFVAAYQRANLPTLAWLFSRPTLRPVLNVGYRFFAKYRHTISGVLGPPALWLANKKRG
ncbi:putative DCC family thiol-disulfide oxidoreductase YuxK [Polynucleobacter brandtiae]|uniref:Putative DCC family thiol-disulfide oxidoreductase YuxK n=2 Tax=Polynucleobacter brandtiae TaxID=1938816 RepID=A0A2M8VZN2_9BURK|nr:putative DCC family thiol-disulfide oxidoreductase YuxK [Polynucleobacter brandtiae]